jgi:transposase-like protein
MDRMIDDAEASWAATVRELSISACARHLGVTPQSLGWRIRSIERRGRAVLLTSPADRLGHFRKSASLAVPSITTNEQ